MSDPSQSSHTIDLENLPFGKGVEILGSHPSGALFLSKPTGILSHPNKPKDLNHSLLTVAYDKKQEAFIWTDEAGDPHQLYLCHRLDEATSGVLVTALNLKLAQSIRKAFASKKVRKTYRAFLIGKLRRPKELWRDKLLKQSGPRGVRVSVDPRGLPSETSVQLIKYRDSPLGGLSEVHLFPVTGRSHQLRVQSAWRKQPILGDSLYGDFAKNRRFASESKAFSRLFLHAESIEIDLQKPSPLKLRAKCPLPDAYSELASWTV